MSDMSVGPAPDPSATDKDRIDPTSPAKVDAQAANETDSRHGLAGAEAKPFSAPEQGTSASRHRPGDSQTAPDEPNDMISPDRNPGPENADEAPPETEERQD